MLSGCVIDFVRVAMLSSAKESTAEKHEMTPPFYCLGNPFKCGSQCIWFHVSSSVTKVAFTFCILDCYCRFDGVVAKVVWHDSLHEAKCLLTSMSCKYFVEFFYNYGQPRRPENRRLVLSPVEAKAFPREFLEYIRDHSLVYNEGRKQKVCWNCKLGGVKYESGNMIITRYHCQKCNVSLCQGSRGCYTDHHWKQWLNLSKGAPE